MTIDAGKLAVKAQRLAALTEQLAVLDDFARRWQEVEPSPSAYLDIDGRRMLLPGKVALAAAKDLRFRTAEEIAKTMKSIREAVNE